jgi:LPS sulfotransferase NodH
MNESFITIVSGLPRSGTSLMMQMLAAGGCPLLTDNLRAADESNPRGYFELEAVKKLRADQSWLAEARGRAVKIIHALVRELPADGRFQYRVLLMKRPIEEVLASQGAMLARSGKTSADPAVLTRIYQSQLEVLERWLEAQKDFRFLRVEHQRLLANPIEVAAEINEFLGGSFDVAAMAAAVDPLLYRERRAPQS